MTSEYNDTSNGNSGDVLKFKARDVAGANSDSVAEDEHTALLQAQIAQVLTHRSNFFLDILRSKAEREIGQNRARIMVVFDAIDEWVQGEFDKPRGFVGCEFIKTVIQIADQDDPIFRAAAKHKAELVELFEQCLEDLSVENAKEVALQLHLLVDGAITQAQIFNDRGSVKRAKGLAENLLQDLT